MAAAVESNLSTDFRNLVPESAAFRCDKRGRPDGPVGGHPRRGGGAVDDQPWTCPEGTHYAEW
jgi:hypothetical protein